MWILQLNDMRSSQVEIMTTVFRADSREKLESMMKDEECEPYRDGNWGKSYKQGGPLEWFNKPFSFAESIVDVKDADFWADQARQDFVDQIMSIQEAS